MTVGLLTDSLIANLALMKISTYHKLKGDKVDFYYPLFDYNKVYISKIFNYSNIVEPIINNVERGGTGYAEIKRLPEEIENGEPDYSLYPDIDYSLQRFSTGCIRNCAFCVVPKREGKIKPVKPMVLNPAGKWIRVLDNSFFSNPEWKTAIKYLKEKNQPINIEQGIDIRIIDDEQIKALNEIKIKDRIYIAWDNPKENPVDKIKLLRSGTKKEIMCYVLIGFNSSTEEDLYRVETLRELKVDPFVMPYKKNDIYQRRFARWVNFKAIFKTVKWSEYA